MTDAEHKSLVVIQEKTNRRTGHNEAWRFFVNDVAGVLSKSATLNRYWPDLKRKLSQEAGSSQIDEKIVRLKPAAPVLSENSEKI